MNAKRSLLALALFGLSGAASAGMISDNYEGDQEVHYGDQDVIGLKEVYNIASVSASLAGSTLTLNLVTDFAGRAGIKDKEFWDPRDHSKLGIGYGDLFLARDWTPFGAAPYSDDQYDNGTVWEYGFALDDAFSNTGGTGTLYALTSGDNGTSAYLSNEAVQTGKDPSRRDNQEILVKDLSNAVGTGSWSVIPDPDISDGVGDSIYPDKADGLISFTIDLTGTTLLDELTTGDGAIALHWTMFCGNDVIEGEVPTYVPAPGSALLLGLGLAALGAGQLRRRRKESVTA